MKLSYTQIDYIKDLSVIIPIGLHEPHWKRLIPVFKKLPVEVLLVSPTENALKDRLPNNFKWICSAPGRAAQMNTGARLASRHFLWFLHADSQLDFEAVASLALNLKKHPHGLHFFRLIFAKDGPQKTLINQWGVRLRSEILKIPFGDQGFVIKKTLFEALKGYDESLPFGEDHDLLWRARQAGIPIIGNKSPLVTSARKYERLGWGKTTLSHLRDTYAFAFPEYLKTIQKKQLPKKGAVVVFVKTPGVSPVKTRLAKGVGKQTATSFYRQSVSTIEELLIHLSAQQKEVTPYWAVAEEEQSTNPIWSEFDVITQGTGSLGERLHHVYAELIRKYDYVILLGADTPQLTLRHLTQTLTFFAKKKTQAFISGPCPDGGFYLFGGNCFIPKLNWLVIRYSDINTLSDLRRSFKKLALHASISALRDVDTLDDLEALKRHFKAPGRLLPVQKRLKQWLESVIPIPNATPISQVNS